MSTARSSSPRSTSGAPTPPTMASGSTRASRSRGCSMTCSPTARCDKSGRRNVSSEEEEEGKEEKRRRNDDDRNDDRDVGQDATRRPPRSSASSPLRHGPTRAGLSCLWRVGVPRRRAPRSGLRRRPTIAREPGRSLFSRAQPRRPTPPAGSAQNPARGAHAAGARSRHRPAARRGEGRARENGRVPLRLVAQEPRRQRRAAAALDRAARAHVRRARRDQGVCRCWNRMRVGFEIGYERSVREGGADSDRSFSFVRRAVGAERIGDPSSGDRRSQCDERTTITTAARRLRRDWFRGTVRGCRGHDLDVPRICEPARRALAAARADGQVRGRGLPRGVSGGSRRGLFKCGM